jgi:hypothetical protein
MKLNKSTVEYEELIEIFEQLNGEISHRSLKLLRKKLKEVKTNKELYESMGSKVLGGNLKERYETSVFDMLALIESLSEESEPISEPKVVKVKRTSDRLVSKREARLLTELVLSGKGYTEIPKLPYYKKLKELRLWCNEITEIKNLDNLPKLEELYIGMNKLSEISGLDNLVNLKLLQLGSNEITKIKGIAHLENLENLYLHKNDIKELENFGDFLELETLDVSENQITEIKNLESLVYLDGLNLWGNKITEIKGTSHFRTLRRLNLSGNQITEIKNLDNLSELEFLYLSENQISEIKGLENLTRLRELDLRDNNIEELKGLENLKSLKRLRILKNPIKNLDYIEKLEEAGVEVIYDKALLAKQKKSSEISKIVSQSTQKIELYKSIGDDLTDSLGEKTKQDKFDKLDLDKEYEEVSTVYESLKEYWSEKNGDLAPTTKERGEEIEKKLSEMENSKTIYELYVLNKDHDKGHATELKEKYSEHLFELKDLVLSYLSDINR